MRRKSEVGMNESDYRHERLVAALLARDAKLREMLLRTNEGAARDRYGRAAYLIQGAERLRMEDEHRHVAELLVIAGL
jgi:hypothetical protein